MSQPWYSYPIVVPFGNPNFDVQLHGAHDLDIGAPPNYPVTALLPGTISSIASPTWGHSLGVKLDSAYNGIPYMAYLHLSAIAPGLSIGDRIEHGAIVGWVGGGNSADDYQGTTNPTGKNFLNTTDQSSRIQVGVALMRGPEYGVGAGWTIFPPIDFALDPTQIIKDALSKPENAIARAAMDTWGSSSFMFGGPLSTTTGIAKAWFDRYTSGNNMPPPTTREFHSVDWDGNPIIVQIFGELRCEWKNGVAHWHKADGGELAN